jgi:cytochrome c553
MSFRCILGLTALLWAAAAVAQSDPETGDAGVTISVPEEAPPAAVTELTDAHGPAQPGNAEAGAAKAAMCAACHGADGNSADPQYPKLAGQHERYIARQLALYKTGERPNPIMMGFAAPLSPQDMRDLGAHFASQQGAPGMADDSRIVDGPNAGRAFYELGQALWRGGDTRRAIPACAACHGAAGEGNPGPAYPRIAGQHAGYTAAQLAAFRDGAVHGQGDQANVVMAGIAAALTDEEIRSLASYIEGLYQARGAGSAGSR